MDPKLRAQVEKLDVWRLTLAKNEKKKSQEPTKDEKQLAWEAYYAFQMNQNQNVKKNNETEGAPSFHIPHVFRQIAEEKGIQNQTLPVQPKVPQIMFIPIETSDRAKIFNH